ncbi:hypothetical protein [Sinorhizobium meliloti]|uniref:hypothetical protein n=1 Tax=Rhizobium meliloti TaxID=382 RepID=UPI003D6543C7
MTDKLKIIEMKKANGHWTVVFEKSIHNASWLGAPTARVEPEIFIPGTGLHERTPEEVIKEAHREVANDLYRAFKTSVLSIPGVDWDSVKSLTVSEILNQLGLDEEPRG